MTAPLRKIPGYLLTLRDALVDARRRHASVPVAGLAVPRNDEDAYAVQDGVADAFGWFRTSRPTAWKVGASGRTATPNAAPLPATGVRASPATFPAGTFNRMLIEGEIAFRLRVPLEGAPETTEARVAASIGEWLVAIEIVDPRYSDLAAADPALRLADHGLHGALVVGTGAPLPRAIDWTALFARVRCDGAIIKETRGGHPLGDLLFLLPWLARHAQARGAPLAAGDLVTAGTWTGVVEAFPGQRIDVEFPGIGSATARFE